MMMTTQELSNLKAKAMGTINRGGEFVHTASSGIEVKIGYVAGGNFCRAEARAAGGRLIKSHSSMWTHEAVAVFMQLVNIAEQVPATVAA